jgi:hypothetical protein
MILGSIKSLSAIFNVIFSYGNTFIFVTIQVVCKNFVWKKVIIQGLEKILASFERSEGGWPDASRTE